MKALIIYQSRKGTTRKFADEIAKRVHRVFGHVAVKKLEEATADDIRECDLLFLGGRTIGKYLFGQKPDEEWVKFARSMPGTNGKKTVLFTTYDISSGKIFHQMKQHLLPKGYNIIGSMKSSNGKIDYFSAGVLKYALGHHQPIVERSMNQLAEVS